MYTYISLSLSRSISLSLFINHLPTLQHPLLSMMIDCECILKMSEILNNINLGDAYTIIPETCEFPKSMCTIHIHAHANTYTHTNMYV